MTICARSQLLGSSALGLALAVMASFGSARAADICGGGTTTITTAQATGANCVLDAGESVVIDDPSGSIDYDNSGAVDGAINVQGAAGSITIGGGKTARSSTTAIELSSGSSLSGDITAGSNSIVGSAGGTTAILVDNATIAGDIDIENFTSILGAEGIRLTGATTDVDGAILVSGDIGTSGSKLTGNGIIVTDQASLDGGITVSSNGRIATETNAILIEDGGFVASDILTQVSVAGDVNGIAVTGGASVVNGSIIANNNTVAGGTGHGVLIDQASVNQDITTTGTGTITSTSGNGLHIQSSATISGSIVNNGIFFGQNGIVVSASDVDVDIDIRSGSSVTGTSGDGLSLLSGSTVGGDVINAGNISSTGGDGIAVSGSTITGALQNSGNINTDGSDAITISSSTVTGGIENTNNINGAIVIDATSTVASITNSSAGSIGNFNTGDDAIDIADGAAAVTITNEGTIVGNVLFGAGTFNYEGGNISGDIIGAAGSTININSDLIFLGGDDLEADTINIAAGQLLAADTMTGAVNNAGTLQALNDTAITGDYTQAAGGELEVRATSAESITGLTVTGTADLTASDSISIDVVTLPPPPPGFSNPPSINIDTRFDDVIDAGTLNASTITVTDNSAILSFGAEIDGNTVDIFVTEAASVAEILDSVESGGNGGGAAAVLDDLISDGAEGDMQAIVNALNGLATNDEVNAAVQKLLPPASGGFSESHVALARGGATSIVQNRANALGLEAAGNARLVQGRTLPPVTAFAPADAYAVNTPDFDGITLAASSLHDDTKKHLKGKADLPYAAWIKPFAGDVAQGARGGISGFDAQTMGAALGFDGTVKENLRVGVALSYASSTLNGRGDAVSSVETDTVQATLYGSYEIDRQTRVSLVGAFGWNDNDSERTIDFGGLDRTAEANFDSWHGIASVELQRFYRLADNLALQPSLGATYVYAEAEDYSESGADAANLDVEEADADSLDLAVTGRVIYGLADGIELSGKLGLAYDVLAGSDQVTAAFQGGGSSFVTESIEPAAFGVTAGASLDLLPEAGPQATLSYDVEARNDYRNHEVSLKVRFPF